MPVDEKVEDEAKIGVVTGYTPFDPHGVDLLSSGPASRQAPQAATPETDTQAAEAPEDEEPLPEFDPKMVEEFEGLLYIGSLSKTFRWLGHEFKIRTLFGEELLAVALIHKEYIGSIGAPLAYSAAMAAGCLVSVDGKPLPTSLFDDEDPLRVKFERVVKWQQPTINVIYNHYLLLEAKVEEVIASMGKATG